MDNRFPDFDENPLDAKYQEDVSYIAFQKLINYGLSKDDLKKFQKEVKEVIYPWDIKYNTFRINVNRRFNVFPLIIVVAETAEDVRKAFLLAKKYKIEFRIRSGAHNNEGYSLCSGMVIDQSRRKKIIVNKDDLKNKRKHVRVTIESGVDNGEMTQALSKYGLFVPQGTCPNVNVIPLASVGVGFTMRRYSLSCDNVLEIDMILADGSYVKVDKHNHPDLFWACKGSGNCNYGIFLDYTFIAHRVDKVTLFEFSYDLDKIEQILEHWQRWAPFTTSKITAEFNIFSENSLMVKDMCKNNLFYKPCHKVTIRVDGLYLGNKHDLEPHIKKFIELEPEDAIVKMMSYEEACVHFAGKPHRLPFFNNRTSFAEKLIPHKGIKIIKDNFKKAPYDSVLEFQAFGGAVADVSNTETAFPNRNCLFWARFASLWYDENDQDKHLNWVDDIWNDFQPFSNHHSYVNFSDSQLGDKYMDYYYGDNKYRLRKIKKKYDPEYTFTFPQVIR
jgi:FAD/FMN-containing dehydrogenase